MHAFEIAEHGLQERGIAYYSNVEKFTIKEFISIENQYIKKRKQLKTMRKYLKKNIKKNKKMLKKIRRLIFPAVYNPSNAMT